MTTDHKLQRAKSLSLQALLAAFLGIATVVWRLRLWNFDLRVPLVYWGDALYETALVKALTESHWNYYIDRLGAPFGMAAVDYPIGCTLDFAIMKVMSFIIRDGCLVANMYWLLNIALAAAFAALFLSSFRVSTPAAICFGALFSVIPFTFYRNISHLDLVHFTVPAAAWVASSLWRYPPPQWKWLAANGATPSPSRYPWLLNTAICAAVGLSFAYWAFFMSILVATGALVGSFRYRTWRVFALAAFFIGMIGIFAVADVAGTLVYWHQHGRTTAMELKSAAEADVYGLTVRHMLTPIIDHPWPAFAALRDKFLSAHFPTESAESAMPSLGLLGTIGFLLLLVITVARPSHGVLGDAHLARLGAACIAILLVAGIGGFGSIFNVLVIHEFRCYNRMSPYISLFAFTAIATVLTHLLRNKRTPLQYGVFASCLLVGAVDQIPAGLWGSRAAQERGFYDDRTFIGRLEARLPAHAMIFQLPYTEFSPDGGHERMGPYDHVRAYLQSRSLAWSWGAMAGRHSNWTSNTAQLPTKQFLERITVAGFRGVLIDRNGYVTLEKENAIRAIVGQSAVFDEGNRWVYCDVGPVRAALEREFGSPDWPAREQAARFPLEVTWSGKFSTIEKYGAAPAFRWCGTQGSLSFTNNADISRRVEIEGQVRQFSRGMHRLSIRSDSAAQEIEIQESPMPFRTKLRILPRSEADLVFAYDGPSLPPPPGETREFGFQVIAFHWSELGDHGEQIASGE